MAKSCATYKGRVCNEGTRTESRRERKGLTVNGSCTSFFLGEFAEKCLGRIRGASANSANHRRSRHRSITTVVGSGRWGAMQGTGILIDITAKVLHHYQQSSVKPTRGKKRKGHFE